MPTNVEANKASLLQKNIIVTFASDSSGRLMLRSEQDQETSRSSGPPWNELAEAVVSYRSMDFLHHLQQGLIGKCDALCAGMMGFRNKSMSQGKDTQYPMVVEAQVNTKGSSALLAPKVLDGRWPSFPCALHGLPLGTSKFFPS